MTNYEYVKNWISSYEGKQFQYGIVSFDIDDLHTDGVDKTEMQRRIREETRIAYIKKRLTDLIKSGEISIDEAQRTIKEENAVGKIYVTNDLDELVTVITNAMNSGANAWDNGDNLAWQPGGLFVVHFWHDPSHSMYAD
jgi:hypothetical protein